MPGTKGTLGRCYSCLALPTYMQPSQGPPPEMRTVSCSVPNPFLLRLIIIPAGVGAFPFMNGGISRLITNCEPPIHLSEANSP